MPPTHTCPAPCPAEVWGLGQGHAGVAAGSAPGRGLPQCVELGPSSGASGGTLPGLDMQEDVLGGSVDGGAAWGLIEQSEPFLKQEAWEFLSETRSVAGEFSVTLGSY